MGLVARSWNGLVVKDKINRAGGRSIIAISVGAATETKRVTHVLSGTLRRSVHTAPATEFHDNDEDEALSGNDLLMDSHSLRATQTPIGPMMEVGSWISYAAAEWIGRNHPGVEQGVEAMRGAKSDLIVAAAFREEGF